MGKRMRVDILMTDGSTWNVSGLGFGQGQWFIHRGPKPGKTWRVTHLPSMMLVKRDLRSQTEARELALKLMESNIEWDGSTAPSYKFIAVIRKIALGEKSLSRKKYKEDVARAARNTSLQRR